MLFWVAIVALILCIKCTCQTLDDEFVFHRKSSNQEAIICDCGFIDDNNQIWSNIWYANFENYRSSIQADPHYQIMSYTVRAKNEEAFERTFERKNVDMNDHGGNVKVSVTKFSNGNYTSGSLGTKRTDILYGTFRARMKTSQIPGTVAAFFFYHSRESEIDMESLSRFTDPHQIYFAIQPQIYVNDSASNVTHEKHKLGFDPTKEFHEYRFDWYPQSVKFYIDDQFVREMTTNIPESPGRILVNHWTDGNPNFSGGPPSEDAHLLVSNLNFFFNSSDPKLRPTCLKSKKPCRVSEIMNNDLIPEGDEQVKQESKCNVPKVSLLNIAASLICAAIF